jgi:DNA-binding CsgD family transcriptional regulator
MVSAVIRTYVERGRHREARKLLRRALNLLLSADHAWELLLDAAAIGEEAEQRMARKLLIARGALPNGGVAAAYLNLFDAHVAKRRGNGDLQRKHGMLAAQSFESLGWRAQTRLAHSYAGPSAKGAAHPSETTAPLAFRTLLGDASKLTSREEEVAQLVLRGLTNRAIARQLAISEHTVESHMTSIMNRLGIRSRHQLGDTLSIGVSRMTELS